LQAHLNRNSFKKQPDHARLGLEKETSFSQNEESKRENVSQERNKCNCITNNSHEITPSRTDLLCSVFEEMSFFVLFVLVQLFITFHFVLSQVQPARTDRPDFLFYVVSHKGWRERESES
jgi:hypothetical protein